MTTKIEDQPPPLANELPHVADVVIGWWESHRVDYAAVIVDMRERKRLGIERYGVALKPHNGRNALVDAYQESLDACQYLAQAILERSDPSMIPGLVPNASMTLVSLFWRQTSIANELRKLID